MMATRPRLTGFGYGTAKDRHDRRDHLYVPRAMPRSGLPQKVDLRPHMPPVYNQHHLNACSANAIAAALWFEERHRHRNPRHPSPSRLFIYFTQRAMEGIIAHNDPVQLRDGYKTVAKLGVCSEHMWPYDVRRFRRRPLNACYQMAEEHKAIRYARLDHTLTSMRACLADQQPFTVGVELHKTFKSQLVRQTGVVPLPAGDDKVLGGHAMLVVGYFDDSRHFVVRNSWGSTWGDGGHCYIPYSYLLRPDLCWDLWTVAKVT